VPLVLLAEVLADVPAFMVTDALSFGAVNITEAGLAFALLRRVGLDPGFSRIEDGVKCMPAAPLAAAIGGATVSNVFRGAKSTFVEFLLIGWSGHAPGLMIPVPVILCLWMPSALPRTGPRGRRSGRSVSRSRSPVRSCSGCRSVPAERATACRFTLSRCCRSCCISGRASAPVMPRWWSPVSRRR
jgi:hypothetical protein